MSVPTKSLIERIDSRRSADDPTAVCLKSYLEQSPEWDVTVLHELAQLADADPFGVFRAEIPKAELLREVIAA